MTFNPQDRSAQPKQSGANTRLDYSAPIPPPQKRVFLQAH